MASPTPLTGAFYRFVLNRTPTARFFMTRVGVAENPSKMRLTSPETRQWFSSVTRGTDSLHQQITCSMMPWQRRQYSTEKDAPPKSTLGKDHFDKLVRNNKVVVFMKGVPDEPRCGFSNAVVQILRMHGVTNYDSHNVLEDENIRQGVKEYTNWPTIPQVFVNGEFVGGCDILIEMHKSGELVEQLNKAGIKSALLEADEFKGKGSNDKK